jgi:type I restriction enzyme S subunit
MSKDLPENWMEVPLPEIATVNMGQSPPSSTYNTVGKGLPFFQGKAEFGDIYPSPVKACSNPLRIAQADDILISVRAPVGPTNLCREKSCFGRGLAAIRPSGGIPSRYLLYYLRSIEEWLSTQGTGSTFTAISKSDLEGLVVRLAPLNEQRRIVAKLENLLAKVDASQQRLAKIPIILKRFRQSVLAAACSGRLTADWRGENPCAAIRGADPPENAPETPESWKWNRLGEVAHVRGGVTKGRKLGGKKTIMLPYLRVANVQDGYLDLSEIKQIEVLPEDETKYQLESGDVLFTEGGDRDKLGRGTVWHGEIPKCIHQNHIFRARLLTTKVTPEYISLVSKGVGKY